MTDYDIVIIGGGPVGMFATFYAGLRDTKVALFESLDSLGGQVDALYPEKNILDVAGFVGVKGSDLIDKLNEQMQLFDHDLFLSTTVIDVAKMTDGFMITTDKKQQVTTKTVVITTGKGAFEPRKMQVSGIDELVGQGVHYFVPNKRAFTNKKVMITGGGDSAVDMATMLNEVAQSVQLVHRRDQFRAMEQSVKELNQSTVVTITPYKITTVTKLASGQLDVTLEHIKTGATKHEIIDDLVVNFGFTSENKTIQAWQIQPETDANVFVVNQEMQTSIDGVFAIGDATRYAGRADLIALGFGEVPQAINAAIRNFDPNRGGPGHSSAMVIK